MTGRHMEITPRLRDYANEKASRLERFFDRIHRLQIILESEGDDRHKAELVISVPNGSTLVSQAQDSSMYAAIDLVLDKAERQLRKHKEKIRNHRVRKPEEEELAGGAIEERTDAPEDASEEDLDVDLEMGR
jgi:putative sigma-54 modulation protein